MDYHKIWPGSEEVTIYVQLTKNDTPVTGITIAQLDITGVRHLSAPAKADASALGSATAPWNSSKMFEVSSANAPGLYRLDLANVVIAGGKPSVEVVINHASLIDAKHIHIDLDIDPAAALRGFNSVIDDIVYDAATSKVIETFHVYCYGTAAAAAAHVIGGGQQGGFVGGFLGTMSHSSINMLSAVLTRDDTIAAP